LIGLFRLNLYDLTWWNPCLIVRTGSSTCNFWRHLNWELSTLRKTKVIILAGICFQIRGFLFLVNMIFDHVRNSCLNQRSIFFGVVFYHILILVFLKISRLTRSEFNKLQILTFILRLKILKFLGSSALGAN